MASTMGDLIGAVEADATKLAADQVAITNDQTQLSTDAATQIVDTTKQGGDQTSLAAALKTSGPVVVANADGLGVTEFAASPTDPTGYVETVIPYAGSVPIPSSGGSGS